MQTHPLPCAIIAGLCFVGAICAVAYTVSIKLRWPKVAGTITRYRISRGDGQGFYHPAYRFKTVDGQPLVGLSSFGWWRRPWPRGSNVSIRYHPDNPRRTEVQCIAANWGIALTLIALAIGFWAFYWIM